MIYWIGVFVYFCLYGLGHSQPLLVSFFVIMVDFPFQILATYAFLYFQLPLLFKRKYLEFSISLLALGYLFYLGVHFNHDFGIGTNLISWHKPHTVSEILTSGEFLFRQTVDIYIVVFTTAIIKFVKDHWASQGRIEQLQAEVARVEYNSVVAGVDSALVLDTLDKIISSNDHNNRHTSEMIAALSHVLDGVLYKTRSSTIKIEEEIDQLESYLQLVSQVYPDIQMRNYEREVTDIGRLAPVLSLHKVMSFLYAEIKKQVRKATLDILLFERDECLYFQITVSEFGDRTLDLRGLEELFKTHFEDDVKHHILEEKDQIVIKIMME